MFLPVTENFINVIHTFKKNYVRNIDERERGETIHAETTASIMYNFSTLTISSRSIVALICSDPGVMWKRDLAFSPCFMASLTIEAQRPMSSYDELVQDPINPAFTSRGQPFSRAASPT